jgi:hypothetical protein
MPCEENKCMKTIKVMSIVGLCMSLLCWVCLSYFNNAIDYESSIGWGFIAVFYLIALSIVGLVQANKHLK